MLLAHCVVLRLDSVNKTVPVDLQSTEVLLRLRPTTATAPEDSYHWLLAVSVTMAVDLRQPGNPWNLHPAAAMVCCLRFGRLRWSHWLDWLTWLGWRRRGVVGRIARWS